LLALQQGDGGFFDERQGVRRVDGWVKGYEEPQGLSNTFATWFRLIAIAMIARDAVAGLASLGVPPNDRHRILQAAGGGSE